MRKTAKDGWIDFLLKAALQKQTLERVAKKLGCYLPSWWFSYYTNVCIKMGRVLERMHQRKIKDGVGRITVKKAISLSNALIKITKATNKFKEVIGDKDKN